MKKKLELAGTQTEINLAKSFAGECQAKTRYLYYAEKAKESGYPNLEEVFLVTADNERGHAETFYEFLVDSVNNNVVQVQTNVPVAEGSVPEILFDAAKGEYEEWSNIYPLFSRVAEEEGFDIIAKSYSSIAEVERRHDFRFRELLKRFQNDMLYRSNENVVWECINCGYRHTGKSAPDICPACLHPKEYFRIISLLI